MRGALFFYQRHAAAMHLAGASPIFFPSCSIRANYDTQPPDKSMCHALRGQAASVCTAMASAHCKPGPEMLESAGPAGSQWQARTG